MVLYPLQPNSPPTETATYTSSSATSVEVTDASVLPAGPNMVVLGDDTTCETIIYTGKSVNVLTGVTRGVDNSGISDGAGSYLGAARAWDAGTPVRRNITAKDINDIQTALSDIDFTEMADLSPQSYSGKAYNFVVVNSTADGITFISLDPSLSSDDASITLPASPRDKYTVDVVGNGTNWVVTANTGQYIRALSVISASGGSIASTSEYDCVCLVYSGSNTWVSKRLTGVLEVV